MLQKPDSVFDLKWNNFAAHLADLSSSLLQDSSLLDISIQCGPEMVRAHKLVLSACSPWFKEVFINMPANPSPLVVLWETKMVDMKNILSFMYNGEVQVEQDSLLSFLKLAKYLQVKGLTEGKEREEDEAIETAEKVLQEEEKMEERSRKDQFTPKMDESMTKINEPTTIREEPVAKENARPRSRMVDDSTSRSRKETASASRQLARLSKEDFELKKEDLIKRKTEKKESFADKKEKSDLKSSGKSEFEIKQNYERAKVKEMRIKEIMKSAGKEKNEERYYKKKSNSRRESLGQELKALQKNKEIKNSSEDVDYEDHMRLQAMFERKSMLEKISNASLNRFETPPESAYSHPDFDPSLLVKAEIGETETEEEIDTSGPDVSLETSPSSFSKPSGSWCTICNKGPFVKMSQHMQNVHSAITYQCTTCVKTFKCQRYLQNHKRQYCPERFTKQS